MFVKATFQHLFLSIGFFETLHSLSYAVHLQKSNMDFDAVPFR